MCVPKPPAVEQIPTRQAARLPDQGDPAVRENIRRKRFATGAMSVLGSTLGAPSVSNVSTLGA